MDDAAEKSHEPTPHRREQAREQGQIARSQDLGNAALLFFSLLVFHAMSGTVAEWFAGHTMKQLGGPAWLEADARFASYIWNSLWWSLGPVLLPVLLLMAVAAAGTQFMQVGWLFLPEKLSPDISRIDPLKGFGRIFSMQGVMRLAFGFLKIGIILIVAYNAVIPEQNKILSLDQLETGQIAMYLFELIYWVSLKIAMALLILAVLDYGFQWWKQEQELKMSQQEMKEEMKQMQGDPMIAARRKQVQRELVMHRLKSDVPKADVVITNPTELAIAVQYDPQTMAAPVVVAKGAGVLAQRIRLLALEKGIPIVERKPLAQALYKEVDVGRPIPSQQYAAVAEVLAYVYQLKGKKMPA